MLWRIFPWTLLRKFYPTRSPFDITLEQANKYLKYETHVHVYKRARTARGSIISPASRRYSRHAPHKVNVPGILRPPLARARFFGNAVAKVRPELNK